MTAAINNCKVALGRFYDRSAYIHSRDCVGADWLPQQVRDFSFIGTASIGTASRLPDAQEPLWRRLWRFLRGR